MTGRFEPLTDRRDAVIVRVLVAVPVDANVNDHHHGDDARLTDLAPRSCSRSRSSRRGRASPLGIVRRGRFVARHARLVVAAAVVLRHRRARGDRGQRLAQIVLHAAVVAT